MKDKLFEVHVCENYKRDVYIKIIVPEDKITEFNEILEQFDGMNEGYEEIVDSLSTTGFEITRVDYNYSLFDFEDNCFIDSKEVKDNG